MKHKKKIYVLIGMNKTLRPIRGDLIETIKFCIALSKNYDVYYNDMFFDPSKPNYGLYDKEVCIPNRKYSLYYVRANNEMFQKLPKPKVMMAYPYDKDSFACADRLVVTTEAWKKYLQTFNSDENSRSVLKKWYDSIDYLPPIINIGQYINPWINDFNIYDIEKFKIEMGYGRIFSMFGRIDDESLPFMFQNIFPELQRIHPDIELIYAGKKRPKTSRIPTFAKYIGQIPFENVGSLTRASFVNLCNEEIDAEYLGSGKVLDSIGAGVPILTKKTSVRIEQLGDNYPLYYDNETQCFDKANKILTDLDFYNHCKNYILNIKNRHEIDVYAQKLKHCFDDIIYNH